MTDERAIERRTKTLKKAAEAATVWRNVEAHPQARSRARQCFNRALRRLAADPIKRLHYHLAIAAVADAKIADVTRKSLVPLLGSCDTVEVESRARACITSNFLEDESGSLPARVGGCQTEPPPVAPGGDPYATGG